MDNTTTTAVPNPPETTSQLIRQVRKYTRRNKGADDKIRIILEGMKREVSISDLCRQEKISPAIYYNWLRDFMEAGKARLKGDTVRSATKGDVEDLKGENERLKILLAEQMLRRDLQRICEAPRRVERRFPGAGLKLRNRRRRQPR